MKKKNNKIMRNLDIDEQVCSSNERFSSMAFSNQTSGYYDAKKTRSEFQVQKKEG